MVDIFSANIMLLLNTILSNQTICKCLYYNQNNPQSQPDISDTTILIYQNLFPYPFNPNINNTDTVQLHAYYGDGLFGAHEVMSDTKLILDILIPSALYMVNDGEPAIRPYVIMNELVNQFSDKQVGSLGTVFFKRFVHLNVNEKYDCIRVICDTKSIR